MKLLIDFGNTRCKWVSVADHEWQSQGSFTYEGENLLDALQQHLPLRQAKEVHVVSVLGKSFENECQLALAHTATCHFYHSQAQAYSIQLAYKHPESYGVDRFAALVAAHESVPGDKIIIDCGTAVTIDALKHTGKHLGGLIVPSVMIMCKSLCRQTADLSFNQNSTSSVLFADNTEDAIYSGSAFVASYGLEAIITKMRATLDQANVVLTGGGIKHMIGLDSMVSHIRPNLVLEGLEIMATRNTTRSD